MKVVIQRVTSCFVSINGNIKSKIGKGLLVLASFEDADNKEDIEWMSRKVSRLRIFNDKNGLMNISVKDINGEIIIVSQFTLYASTKKGNRPSFIGAAKPVISIPLYELFVEQLEKDLCKTVETGKFGANMQISIVNDGPVTIIIDSKNKI